MEKIENRLWKIIKPLFPVNTNVNRIESHATALGFPDLEICATGVPMTVELKAVHKITDDVKIRASQISWAKRRIRAGGNPLILLWVEEIDNFYVIGGSDIVGLQDHRAANYIERAKAVLCRDEIKTPNLLISTLIGVYRNGSL